MEFNPVFGKLIDFYALLIYILGDFPSFLLALVSNNVFIIKLVKMWPSCGGRNFEDKLRSTFFFLQRSLLSAVVSLMPACKSKFVSGSRKATVAKAVFLG